MTCDQLFAFLDSHHDWHPCMRLHGDPQITNYQSWRIETVGVIGPEGHAFNMKELERAMFYGGGRG